MKLIHIVGRQNNGKTTLIVELVKELNKRGLRIGTIKHSGHEHELDKPGKDSYRHRHAGGTPAAAVTANMMAIYLPRQVNENPLEKLHPFFNDVDLLIIEGFVDGPGKKIEVWREKVGTVPRVLEREDIDVVITDDNIDTQITVWPRNDIAKIADNICTLVGINSEG